MQAPEQSANVRKLPRTGEELAAGDDEGKALGQIHLGHDEPGVAAEGGVGLLEHPVDRGEQITGREDRNRDGCAGRRWLGSGDVGVGDDVRDVRGDDLGIAKACGGPGRGEQRLSEDPGGPHRLRCPARAERVVGQANSAGLFRRAAVSSAYAESSSGSARQRSRAVTSRRGRRTGSSHRPCAWYVSGQSEPYLSPGAQCDGGWWRWCPRAEGKGS